MGRPPLTRVLLSFLCWTSSSRRKEDLKLLCDAEFVYFDFNGTTGLALNGNAATTSCIHITTNEYSPLAGAQDLREASLEVVQVRCFLTNAFVLAPPKHLTERFLNIPQHQQLEKVMLETSTTFDPNTSDAIASETASLGHRDTFTRSITDRCAVRLRLTGSQPHQVSSIWYAEQLPVLQGFETRFAFQISDQSQRCFNVKDQNFGIRHHQTCLVHGGDGFAFVIHSNPDKGTTMGVTDTSTQQRSYLGYEGIANSLAIEFDTWFDSDKQDVFYDHLSIQSGGIGSNGGGEEFRLSTTALYDLADGKIHMVKIRYYTELRREYAPYFSATKATVQYLKDMSEGRRMGTLCVFMDDGITTDVPLLAIPINLAATLRMDSDEAYAGFTASTGNAWQKQDILNWYYCTQPPCLDQYGNPVTLEFDYNQQSMTSTASFGKSLYPLYIYPDTAPWAKRQSYFAQGQQLVLSS